MYQPIGYLKTPFPEKFGIPRQPGLAQSARGELILHSEFDQPGVFDGLEECSHVWLLFRFHEQPQEWSPKVRPPRLGGNRKFGVFATRSPRRPNPIGLSAVQLLKVDGNRLLLGGVDLVDGTPILDVKPYVPYSDCLPEARFNLTPEAPSRLPVEFHDSVQQQLETHPELKALIEETLSLDPRPAYHQDEREYGTALHGYNVRWRVRDERVEVLSLEEIR